MSYATAVAIAEVFTLGVKAGVKAGEAARGDPGRRFGQGNLLKHRLPNIIFKDRYSALA